MTEARAKADPAVACPLGRIPGRAETAFSEAIAINVSRLDTSLRQQRSAMLTGSLPGSLRVFFGAAIVSAFLVMIRRHASAQTTTITRR